MAIQDRREDCGMEAAAEEEEEEEEGEQLCLRWQWCLR